MSDSLTVVVVGATGDLARRKLFPALFACFARGHLPSDVRFVGVARTDQDEAAFRARLAGQLTCEELEAGTCSLRAGEFLQRCHYRRCAYDSAADFRACDAWLTSLEGGARANRVLYLAVPPFVFGEASAALSQGGMLPRTGGPAAAWTRLVVEKPFGRDRASYDELQRTLSGICEESQTFRIDHYLGKEVVQNLLVLRFANVVLNALWQHQYVQHVHIAWSERQGVAGRAGYFDHYGIIRDVMQNHLMQILTLVAMEPPARLDAAAIQDAKVAVLRSMRPLDSAELIVGQYTAGADVVGYLQEEGVPADSETPTYAAAVMHVDTPRWQGVPFLLSAGKGLSYDVTEVRLHFRPATDRLFQALTDAALPDAAANELIIRVQPDERLLLRIVSKVPGMGLHVGATELDLGFREKYPGVRIADAYENLLLDVVRGDRSQFLRSDELEAAWDLFTPALQALEQRHRRPVPYVFGGSGPAGLDELAMRHEIADARIVEQDYEQHI